jgi:hypothetical protein
MKFGCKKIWRASSKISRSCLVWFESVVCLPDFPVFVAGGSVDARRGAQLVDCKSRRFGRSFAVDLRILIVDVDFFDLIEKLLLLDLTRDRNISVEYY